MHKTKNKTGKKLFLKLQVKLKNIIDHRAKSHKKAEGKHIWKWSTKLVELLPSSSSSEALMNDKRSFSGAGSCDTLAIVENL